MLAAARRFATLVVLVHLLLLMLVVGVVLFAAFHIYGTARSHAIEETSRRQALIARQTAAGIESYYRSIIADLVVLQRSEEATTQPSPPAFAGAPFDPTTQSGPPGGLRRGRSLPRPPFDARARFDMRSLEAKSLPVTPALTGLMWRMLQNRATLLFVYDPHPPALPSGDAPAETGVVIPQMVFPARSLPAARRLVSENAVFLDSIAREPAVSAFVQLHEDGMGGHLIAVPATGGAEFGDRVLVAFVPLHAIKTEFFDELNREGNVNAALLDKSGTALVAIEEMFTGHNIIHEVIYADPALKELLERHIAQAESGTWTVKEPSQLGSRTIPPRIVATEPVDLADRRWSVIVTSPLSEVDGAVRPVFRGALMWAIFLSISVTAIFASTAFQLIRNRVRLERATRDLLSRELKQARNIQLAWLPDGTVPPPGLNVAATNIPASHISGDFYNWFALPAKDDAPPKIAVCIGDVSGHGMSAAFLMATTQLLIHNTMQRCPDAGECLTDVNRQLRTQAFRGQFVTLLLLVIDTASRTVELVAAGHPGPLIAAGDGTRQGVDFRPLQVEPQFLLGVVEDTVYSTQRFGLPAGATLLLYTDGLIEAFPHNGPQLGLGRVLETLRGGFPSLQAVLDTLVAAVHAHSRQAELSDDVTLVALQLPQTAMPASPSVPGIGKTA